MNQNEIVNQISKLVRADEAHKAIKFVTAKILREPDANGIPLVHLFAIKGKLDLIEKQLTVKTVEVLWGQKWTVAHTAAAATTAGPLKRVLKKGKHLLYWADSQGRTPLHLAALNGNLNQFEIEPAQLTLLDYLKSTPMHYAAVTKTINQISELISHEMLLIANGTGESVLNLINSTKQVIPETLKDSMWRAEFRSNPEKHTWSNFFSHIGISQKGLSK